MLRTTKPTTTYEVYDEQGRSVGCVILPKSPRVIGPNQGTVLLRRPTPKPRTITAQPAAQEARKAS